MTLTNNWILFYTIISLFTLAACQEPTPAYEDKPAYSFTLTMDDDDTVEDDDLAPSSGDGVGDADANPDNIGDDTDATGGQEGGSEDQTTGDDFDPTDVGGDDLVLDPTEDDGADSGGDSGDPNQDGGNGDDTPPSESDNEASIPSESDIDLCSRHFRVNSTKVKGVNFQNGSSLGVGDGEIMAIKLTGNQTRLDLNLVGNEDQIIRGICVFMAGNRSQLNLNAQIDLGGLVYYGRGNRSTGAINIAEGHRLTKLYVDLAGANPQLTLSGAGEYPCDPVRLRNKKAEFHCQ